MDEINISGFDKADVLAALYNRSQPLGLGHLHYDPKPMTKEEAAELLKSQTYFDYLKGRVMKINLSKDVLVVTWYDRDNGQGAAAEAISGIGE